MKTDTARRSTARRWVGATFLLLSLGLLVCKTLPAEVVPISDSPQLFLDDYVVARSTNVRRQVTRPTKRADNPLIVQELPWERRLLTTYGTVLYDENAKQFRCWYTAGEFVDGIPDVPDGPVTAEYYICYAQSPDGIHWEKPLVSKERFGLHDEHNIVVPGGHGFCVLPEPGDPDPSRRYKGVGGPIFGFSPDGIRWQTHNWRDTVRKNDTSSCVVRWKGEYLAYVRYQVDDPDWPAVMRGIGLCRSDDFNKWTSKELIFTTDDQDGYPWTQPYGMAVTPYGDQLIGILWLLHLDEIDGNNSLGDEDTQLVVSRDGIHWNRVADRGTFLASTPGTWDEGRIHAPSTTMFVKDDVVYIYYSASETRHGSGKWGKPGIGLATLPADRFVAVRPKKTTEPGVLETPPLKFTGDTLVVNADVHPADLKVELLDGNGNVLAGFGRDASCLVRHDALRYQVFWKDTPGKKSIGDTTEPVAIRFRLCRGALYAFQVTSQPKKGAAVRELSLRGTPYQRGHQHGQAFQAEIGACLASFEGELENRSIADAVDKTITFLEDTYPELNEEIRGMSDGAQVAFRDLFLFNNRAVVNLLDRESCSDFAVQTPRGVMVGMNKDRAEPIAPYDQYFLKKNYPRDGYASISYGHVGRIWGHGMNQHGLCTAGTAAHPENNKPEVPSFGSYLLPSLLLSKCKDVPEALALLETLKPVCDAGNFMLVDRSGQMAVVEITPHERIVRGADNGHIVATTYFGSGKITHQNNPAHLLESQQRCCAIEDYLSTHTDITTEDMQRICRLHPQDGAVCRHPDSGVSTVLSWIAIPESGEFYFCDRAPCDGEYQLFKLDE